MFAYRTPGVHFEWLDSQSPSILPLRTDIAGFVGIAERGPLHHAVRVESYTQFASIFGRFIPEGYLAYAVEGFFANGGQTCWVVRVADPDLAAAASLDLRAGGERTGDSEASVLRLTAACSVVWRPETGEVTATQAAVRRRPPPSWRTSPGVWGQNIAVTVDRTNPERFALTLRLPDGGQEVWHDLTMALASLDLLDDADQPALRLIADRPDLWQLDINVSVTSNGGGVFSLRIQVSDHRSETWSNLTMLRSDPSYVERILNNPETGSGLIVARDLSSSALFPQATPAPRALHLPKGQGRMKPEPRYVRTLLNDLEMGSRLVAVEHLPAQLRFPRNTPGPHASNLIAGTARLTGGRDGLAPSLNLLDHTDQATLCLIASGRWNDGQNIQVTVDRVDEGYFSLALQAPDQTQEIWPRLSMQRWFDESKRDPNPAYVETVLNDPQAGSRLITARDLHSDAGFPDSTPVAVSTSTSGGLGTEHFMHGLATLEDKSELSILAIPDIMPKTFRPLRIKKTPVRCDVVDGKTLPSLASVRIPEFAPAFTEIQIAALQNAMVGQCERLKDRVAVLDAPRFDGQDVSPTKVIEWRNRFDTKYAALYYPWLRVPDALGLDRLLRDVPPCGHVAGVYARVDRRIGVHKPPANEEFFYAQDVSTQIEDLLHGDLNDRSVNVIRAYRGRGLRLAGARTLSSDPDWRYVNVRRLLIMIEEAFDQQTQWLVFEPNNPDVWREVDRVVRSFLDSLWHRGMLDGLTTADAYSVTCDATTNPPEQTEMGRLVCRIGVQPPWPAEFVVVRIGKTESGTQVIETSETGMPGGM